MLTKFIKFSFLLAILILQSCILFESDEERDRKNTYSCSMHVTINSWSKSARECNYLINYTNPRSFTSKGKFQFTMKSATTTYLVYSNELTLNDGNNTIPIELSNCKFQDEIITVCFYTK